MTSDLVTVYGTPNKKLNDRERHCGSRLIPGTHAVDPHILLHLTCDFLEVELPI